jgi:hypothetical protein
MTVSLNHEQALRDTFNKPCIIKDGEVSFEHLGKKYRLTSDCFKDLDGKTVLINSALEVNRGEVQIGKARKL